jgi:hypothetical protein
MPNGKTMGKVTRFVVAAADAIAAGGHGSLDFRQREIDRQELSGITDPTSSRIS